MSTSETRFAARGADRAYQLIRRDIFTGVLAPGRHLGEVDLAEQYGFSRTPIREGLRRLESEGLVEVLPHRGARVMDWSEIDLSELYALRARVEGFAAAAAAPRIEEEHLSRLEVLCEEMEQITRDGNPGDPQTLESIAAYNTQLHGLVADAAGNFYIDTVRKVVVVGGLIRRGLHAYTLEDLERSNHHHRELVAALRARDSEWAEAVMLAHIHSSKVHVLRASEQMRAIRAHGGD